MRLLRRSLRRDVAARGTRFATIAVTMLLGVALFGASYDAFQNLTSSYERLYEELGFADLTVVGGDPDTVAARLASDPAVAATATRTVADVPISVGDHRFVGRVVGMPTDREPDVGRVRVLRGGGLDATRPDGVLAEQHLAAAFGLEPGDEVEVLGRDGWRRVEILGVVASPEYLWPARSRQEILVPFDEFGVLFAPEALASSTMAGTWHAETLVLLAPGASEDALVRLAEEAVEAGGSATYTRAEQPSNAALQEDVSGFGELSLAFPLLFLGAGALAMSVLLGRMVAVHRAQIGVLRASGMPSRTILVHYVALGVLVGLVGSAPGAVLGALSAAAITQVYTGVLTIPASVVDVRPATLAVGLAIGPLAGALAAFGPARRAAATSPAEAMRGSAPIGRGSVSLVERVVPPLRRLPARWLVAIRGIGRNRRRSLSTVVGVGLATILIFVSWAMIDTVEILLDRQFNRIQRADAEVVLAGPLPASEAVSVATTEGVEAAEPQLAVPVTIVGDDRYATTLIGLPTNTMMRVFFDMEGRPLALPEDGVLLGAALASRLGVGVGDAVSLELVEAPGTAADPGPTATLRVAGFVDEPLGTFAYASLPTVAAAAGHAADDPAVGSVLVRYGQGRDRTAIRADLASLPSVGAVVDSRALYDMAQDFLGLFYAFVGVMLVLGSVMAFALLLNTLSANIMERSVELIALRSLGMSAATIGRLVTAENVVLTVAALVPGLAIAYVAAALFMASFSSDLFRFDLEVRPTTILGTALAIVAVALLSQLPALRAVNRLELARVVRERAS